MPEPLSIIPGITRSEPRLVQERIARRLDSMYQRLEVPLERVDSLVHTTIELCKAEKPIEDIERDAHALLEKAGAFARFNEQMDLRALAWYQQIAAYLKPGTFLDLGGGDGRTAKRVADECRAAGVDMEVTVADILDYPDRVRKLAYARMRGTRTPFPDRSFGTVFLGTVYHHVGKNLDDPLALMDESLRLARDQVIVIESVYRDGAERLYTMWIDWFYNRVLHYSESPAEKVNVPFNFRPPEDWRERLEERGAEVTVYKDLGTFQWLNPEHHWLYVAQPRWREPSEPV